MASTRRTTSDAAEPRWAEALSWFAGLILATSGLFGFLEGLSAALKDSLYLAGRSYAYGLDLTTWGWIHMVLGAGAVVIGLAITDQRSWGLAGGLVIAVFSAVGNFMFVPHYPLWALVLIALDLAVIWALTLVLSTEP